MNSLESLKASRRAAGGGEAEDQGFQDLIDELKQEKSGWSDWDITVLLIGVMW